MAQQTAAEWLFEKMAQTPMTNWYEIREQALAMEKEQIEKAYQEGVFSELEWRNAEQYYNENFNK